MTVPGCTAPPVGAGPRHKRDHRYFVIDRALTSAIFIEYVRQCLTSLPSDIFVMDNLGPHQDSSVR